MFRNTKGSIPAAAQWRMAIALWGQQLRLPPSCGQGVLHGHRSASSPAMIPPHVLPSDVLPIARSLTDKGEVQGVEKQDNILALVLAQADINKLLL